MTGSDMGNIGEAFESVVFAAVIVAVLCLLAAFYGGFSHYRLHKLQAEAVERGHAHYNPTNGVWQWRDAK